MKIQLDYDNKVITLERNTNLGVFVSRIKSILDDWKEWELDTKTEIVWNKEVVYRDNHHWWNNPLGIGMTSITDGAGNAITSIAATSLNVESEGDNTVTYDSGNELTTPTRTITGGTFVYAFDSNGKPSEIRSDFDFCSGVRQIELSPFEKYRDEDDIVCTRKRQ